MDPVLATNTTPQLQQAADQLIQLGHYAHAYNIYLQLAKDSPYEATYRMKLGELCIALKRPQDALMIFKHLAAHFIQQNQLVQAIALNKQILTLNPQDLDIQKQLEVIYAQKQAAQHAQQQQAHKNVHEIANAPLVLTPVATAKPLAPENSHSQEEIMSLSSDEILPQAKPQTNTANDITHNDYDDSIFDLSNNLDIANNNSNVDLTIGGHDNFNEINPDQIKSSGPAQHLTLMGAEPPRMDTPNIPLFSDLPPKAFAQVMEKFNRYSMPSDSVILRQGDPGDSILIISYGHVRILRKHDSKIEEIGQLSTGDFYGEFAYFSKQPREASLVSLDAVEILELSRACMDEIILTHPKVERAMHNLYKERVLKNLLRESPLFSCLNDLERGELIEKFSHRSFSRNQCIIREGDTADAFYVIQSGSVAVFKHGNPQPLAILKSGEFFGEYAMITGSKRSASIVACENTEVVLLTHQAFRELLQNKPDVLEKVRNIAKQRVAENMARDK